MAPAIAMEYGAMDGYIVVGKGYLVSISKVLHLLSSVMSIDRLTPQRNG